MVKVVHIQYSTQSAGKAALRLNDAFNEMGIQSHIISLENDTPPVNGIIYSGQKHKFISRINTKLQIAKNKNIPRSYGLFSHTVLTNNVAEEEVVKQADVIYVHWVLNGYLSLNSFRQLAKLNKPVIFFMHDMWYMSGGCHYSFGCSNFISGCHKCPMFPTEQAGKTASINYNKKEKLYNQFNNFYFVSPSTWLYSEAKQSGLLSNKPVYYIPNVLDTSVFKNYSKNVARQLLNLDENEIIIAFGAVSVTSPYKGWPYLVDSLKLLKMESLQHNISVLVFGSGYSKEIDEAIPFKKKFLGYLCDEFTSAMVYNAADVLIVPSIADNQPTIVQESLCCGTPVVGFNTGGIPDMIEHKKNGYIAEYKNVNDVVNGIKFCIESKIKGYMLPDFEQPKTMEKHLQLFREIGIKINETA